MRTAPPEVLPLVCGDYRIEAPIWAGPGRDHNGGYLEVFEASTGRPLYRLELYRLEIPPDGWERVAGFWKSINIFSGRTTSCSSFNPHSS